MPNVEENKTVDIDTSGPGAEIELQEEKDESVVDTEASSIIFSVLFKLFGFPQNTCFCQLGKMRINSFAHIGQKQ